jgi:hypothetical protein
MPAKIKFENNVFYNSSIIYPSLFPLDLTLPYGEFIFNNN